MSEPTRPDWPGGHPADEALLARIDGGPPADRPGALEAHVAGCDACRARSADFERIVAAVAADPPLPADDVFAAERERILARLEDPRRTTALRRGAVWGALLTAAAVAALVVLRLDEPAPTTGPATPVVAAAERAAERTFAEVLAESTGGDGAETAVVDGPAPAADPLADLAATTDAATGVPDPADLGLDGTAIESALLDEAFARLPAADREAILDEMEGWAIDL